MKKVVLSVLCIFTAAAMSGCMKTYTYQVERQDQDLIGNKGVVAGEAPPDVAGVKKTRTMTGLDVELPASREYKKQKSALNKGWMQPAEEPAKKAVTRMAPVTTESGEEADVETAGEAVVKAGMPEEKSGGYADEQWVKKEEAPAGQEKAMIYTVREGDTLGKIAKEFLGDASKWTEIYEANKNVIDKPGRIYPGQVIVIPQAKAAAVETKEDVK